MGIVTATLIAYGTKDKEDVLKALRELEIYKDKHLLRLDVYTQTKHSLEILLEESDNEREETKDAAGTTGNVAGSDD